jgi:bacillolysin
MTSRSNVAFALILSLAVFLTPSDALAQPRDQLTPGEHRQLQHITDLSDGTITVQWDEERGTPRLISGKLSKPLKGEPFKMALKFLDTVKELYHVDSPKKSFRLKKVDKDELGMTHVRLLHVARDIPVWGDELIVHFDKDGVVRSINGTFTPKIEANSKQFAKAKISADRAIQSALADVLVEKPDRPPTAMLYYFPYPTPDSVTLTYVVTILDRSVPAEWKVFVDAVSGDVVHKYNNLKFQQGLKKNKQE